MACQLLALVVVEEGVSLLLRQTLEDLVVVDGPIQLPNLSEALVTARQPHRHKETLAVPQHSLPRFSKPEAAAAALEVLEATPALQAQASHHHLLAHQSHMPSAAQVLPRRRAPQLVAVVVLLQLRQVLPR